MTRVFKAARDNEISYRICSTRAKAFGVETSEAHLRLLSANNLDGNMLGVLRKTGLQWTITYFSRPCKMPSHSSGACLWILTEEIFRNGRGKSLELQLFFAESSSTSICDFSKIIYTPY